MLLIRCFFVFKQKTAYEMRISDWSSDVCSADLFGISGKVAFVSGGSKGMAREAALMLAGEGCKVAIVARTQGPIDETVELIRSRGGTAMGVSADRKSVD